MALQLGQIRERMEENRNDLTNKIMKSQMNNGIPVLSSKSQIQNINQ